MSDLGELSVKITGDDADLDKALKGAGDDVNKFDKKTKKTLKSNEKSWGKWAKGVANDLGGVSNILKTTAKVTAGSVAASAVTFIAFSESIAASERELATLANQAGMTVDEFRAMSFAAGTVGVDADQLSGQMEDMRRKFAEFDKVGTGAFQDYADIMNLTKGEAQELAGELSKLAGKDALQLMVNNMEEAKVPAEQMGFVLDSLGSDMDRLIPLLTQGGQKVTELATKFSSLSVAIDKEDIATFQTLSESLGILTGNFKAFLTEALSPLAPMFEDAATAGAAFFKSLVEESRQADKIAEAQENLNKLLDKKEKLNRRGRKSSKSAAASESQQVNDLILANQELQAVVDKVAKRVRADNAEKKAARKQEKIDAANQIEINNATIAMLSKESAAVKEVVKAHKDLANAKAGITQQEPQETSTSTSTTSTDTKEVKLKFTADESQAFVDALREKLGQTEKSLAEYHEKEKAMLDAAVENGVITIEESNMRKLQLQDDYFANKQLIETEGAELSLSQEIVAENERYNAKVTALENLKTADAEYNQHMLDMSTEHNAKITELESAKNLKLAALDAEHKLKMAESELADGEVSYEAEVLAEQARFLNKLAALQELELAESEHNARVETETQRHAKALGKIDKAKDKARVKGDKQMYSNLSAGMNSGNKTLFQLGKAAALANAGIDAASSVVSSYKEGSKIGGPYVGAAYAAAAGIAQGVNIANIASQSYGGGGGSPTSYSGGVPTVNTSSSQSASADSIPQTVETSQVNISLEGSSYTKESVRELIEEINEATGDGVVLNVN